MEISVLTAETAEEMTALLALSRYDFVSLHVNCDQDVRPFLNGSPNFAFHGATSCLGTMTNDNPKAGLAAFALSDPEGAYGRSLRAFDGEPSIVAAQAAREAIEASGRIGERPEMVWISATPGSEEQVLAGIESVVGKDVPIIGGSAADNDVSGQWFLFDGEKSITAGVLVSVLFPSKRVSFAYQNGYSPTSHKGRVTKADGRKVLEIDHMPAVDVYSSWASNGVKAAISAPRPSAILSESTLCPLGRQVSEVSGVPFHLLVHPAVAHEDGALELFATVDEGEEITLMTGTVDGLVQRAGRVASLARSSGPAPDADIAGALMIYCGGCMLTVQDDLGRVAEGVNDALGSAPFLGAYTFGEQGALIGSGNRHGNLMISCIIFEK